MKKSYDIWKFGDAFVLDYSVEVTRISFKQALVKERNREQWNKSWALVKTFEWVQCDRVVLSLKCKEVMVLRL